MRFKEGVDVYTADDKEVGSVDRVVIDPQTKEVTHLVVREGLLFVEDKLVPIGLVDQTTEERVTLRKDAESLIDLEPFREVNYVQADEEDAPFPAGYAPPLYLYPPSTMVWWRMGEQVDYPISPYVVEKAEHIPEGTVPLKEGARVVSRDGEHVGDVEEVLTDPQEDRATHLLIAEGLLLKERKLVPTTWLTDVAADEVHLAVSAKYLEKLPEYEPNA